MNQKEAQKAIDQMNRTLWLIDLKEKDPKKWKKIVSGKMGDD